MPWRAQPIVLLRCALRASRPQLKRDPLGSAATYSSMIKHLWFPLAFSALATPVLAAAQDTMPIDPSVSSVVSGGYWQHGQRAGHYRMIVRSAGFEHVSSTLRVEWIPEGTGKQDDSVLVSSAVDSIPDWLWSLSQPELRCAARVCQFTIQGTEPHVLQKASWVITLHDPGHLTVAKQK